MLLSLRSRYKLLREGLLLKLKKQNILHCSSLSEKKGTKAVTGAVPFQKVHFCT